MVVTSRGTQDELPFRIGASHHTFSIHSFYWGLNPLLVLRVLLARSLVVERSAVNRMVGGSNPPVPVFILQP